MKQEYDFCCLGVRKCECSMTNNVKCSVETSLYTIISTVQMEGVVVLIYIQIYEQQTATISYVLRAP